LIPIIEKFLPVTIFKMGATIPPIFMPGLGSHFENGKHLKKAELLL
jgi:hypothetical protein